MKSPLAELAGQARACTLCVPYLPLGPRPVFQVGQQARILLAAQAPGTKVHASGRPFTDASGERLRDWMGVDEVTFYDATKLAIVPMGFCYPGRGKSGDLPPRKECAAAWRQPFLDNLPNITLTLVIGQYAQHWHLGDYRSSTLTETVTRWRTFAPAVMPLPHPSPRNNIWLKKNAWFDQELIPDLKVLVRRALD
ncbi:MAG: uracil-DNA glycosylase [Gammaproteobacteria bacterium]|jgi:uracil-DNA glycosylase